MATKRTQDLSGGDIANLDFALFSLRVRGVSHQGAVRSDSRIADGVLPIFPPTNLLTLAQVPHPNFAKRVGSSQTGAVVVESYTYDQAGIFQFRFFGAIEKVPGFQSGISTCRDQAGA